MDHLQQADRTLEDLGAILGDLCAAPASCDAPCRAVTMLLDSSSSRFWRSFYALKKRRQDDGLNVAVLALTKSGKSTLLNALVGAELLPMNNVPETARICKVVHTGGGEPYLVEPDTAGSSKAPKAQAPVVTARGEAAVRARLRQLNQAVRDRSSSRAAIARPRTLQPSTSLGSASGTPALGQATSLPGSLDGPSTLLGRSSTGSGPTDDDCAAALAANAPTTPSVATGLPMDKMLEIHAPVAALLEYAPAGHQGGHVRLQLLDTPGPNEAGEEELKHQVERLLDGVDVALYLLDYTKLKTQDEAGMFERLRLVNPALVKRLSQRLFFVVNKVDAAQVSEGQDLEVTKQYVADLVTRQMDLEGFQLQPEQVLLLSARNGLLSRLVLRGTASPETRQRFVQLAFGRFANPATISQEQMVGAAHALLADSGLLDLEAQVLAYLYTHAAAVKHLALVDDLGRLLAEVRNVATSCAAALSASAEALAARVGEVRGQLNQTLTRFESVQNDADAIGNEVAREVHAHLHTLRGRLFSSIINALDTSNSAPTAAPAPAATPAARRWHGVRERFLSIFTGRGSGGVFSTNPTNIASGSGSGSAYYRNSDVEESGDSAAAMASMMNAAGGAVARSRSKAELAALLGALHEDLTTQIHAEVREFWAVMEAVAGARHAELLATLNNHLAELSQQVEGAVSRSLDVRLSPVTLQLTPPDASQFHADLDGLLARGLVETREKHIRVNQKQVTEQVLRRGGGICRWGDYWESVPRMRTVVEAYTLSVYEVVPSEITAHFISMVDNAVDSTQASLEAYVSQFVGTQLKEARQQLQEYSDCYLGVMTGALDANHKGSEHRLAALEQVRSLLARINDVSLAYDTLKDATEGSVPRAQEPIAYDDLDDLSEDEREEQERIEEDDKSEEEEEQEEQEEQAVAAGAVMAAEQAYESAEEGEEEEGLVIGEEDEVAVGPQGMQGGEEEEEALLPLLSEASASITPFAQQLDAEQQRIAPEEPSALPPLDSSTPSLAAAAEGPAIGVPAFEPAGPMADAASDTATVYTPLPPGSPMSVSSSVVNALLRTSLDGLTPAPAVPVAPTEDISRAAEEPATGVAVVDTVDPAEVGMEVPNVAVGGVAKAEMPGGTLTSPRPFDYGEAMSSQMSSSQLGSVGTEEGHGAVQADLAAEATEGSDDWDLVDGKEAQAA